MADWNKNNLAHTNTFLTLRILAMTNRKFAAAGAQKIKGLSFWVEGDSPDMRRGKATSLATQLHNMFEVVFQATFETGATKVNSIKAMAQVLTEGDNTIQVLADTADDKYDFSGDTL